MRNVGASTSTLNYTMHRWDPRWWSLTAQLTNGTTLWVPTVGYYPYSGDTGLAGVTGQVWDAGTFGLNSTTGNADFKSLNIKGAPEGSIMFYYNTPQTANQTEPLQSVAG